MKVENVRVNSLENWIAIAIVISAAGYGAIKQINLGKIMNDLIAVSNKAIFFTAVILSTSLLMLLIYRHKQAHKTKKQQFIGALEGFLDKECKTPESIEKAINELDCLIRENHKLSKKHEKLKSFIKRELNIRKKALLKEENKKKRELELEEQKELGEKRLVKKLAGYFKKKDSDEAIPKWAIRCDSGIIDEAVELYNKIKRRAEEKNNKWQKVAKFVIEHKAFPLGFNELENAEQGMYKKALRLLKKGRLQQELSQEEVPSDKKKFYHADELKPEEREELISRYGYRHKPFLFRNGAPGNNLIIRNDPGKESDYHFCLKHLFAEIDKDNAEIEFAIGDLRADVGFVYSGKKIAVEIETGNNKQIQIVNKVGWLNKNFNNWIFICSRKNKKVYMKHVDNKKSFCLTLKDADKKVQQLIKEI